MRDYKFIVNGILYACTVEDTGWSNHQTTEELHQTLIEAGVAYKVGELTNSGKPVVTELLPSQEVAVFGLILKISDFLNTEVPDGTPYKADILKFLYDEKVKLHI